MFKLIKQCFKLYLKKPWFLITLGASYFVITFLVAACITVMASISTSLNNINGDGKAATLAISGFDKIETSNLIPEFDGQSNYQPEIVKTAKINMNSINVDDWSNLTTDQEKFNFLRIFPNTRADLITHQQKRTFANNPNNNTAYINVPARNMRYVANPLLEFALRTDNAKYGYSVSFYDPYGSQLLSDPRNILFSYDELTNKFKIMGYWNNGNIENIISINSAFTAFKDNTNGADDVFNDPNISSLELNRTNPKTLISDKYTNANGRERALNDIEVTTSAYVGGNNIELIKDRIITMTMVNDYVNSLPFNEIPTDSNVPYIEIVDGYSFSFKLSNQNNPSDIAFRTYLEANDPNNKLLKPLVLDEFNLLGMTLSEYQQLSASEKAKKNENIENNIRQYANVLSSEWKSQKNDWIMNRLEMGLNEKNINYSEEYEYYYQSNENNHEFLYVPKTGSNVNKIIVDEGIDLPYDESNNDIIKTLSNDEDLTVQDLKKFMQFLLLTWTNSNSLSSFKQVTQNLIDSLDSASTIEAVNKLPIWYEWMLRYGNNFFFDQKDSFNYKFIIVENCGFSSINFNFTLNYIQITNNLVLLSNSYFDKNKKKTLPAKGVEWVKKTNDSNEIEEFPVYSLENIINGDYDTNYLNINEFSTYINNVPSEYKISFFDKEFLIIGSGISPDYSYPIVTIQSPIPDPSKQGIVYTTMDMFNSIVKYNNTTNNILYLSLNSNLSNEQVSNYVKNFINQEFNDANLLTISSPNAINAISSLRFNLPLMIQQIIIVGALAISIILFIMLIYTSFMMLNIIIEKLSDIIAICRAEGFSLTKIAFCVAIPLILFAGIIGGLSYILTFSLSAVLLGSFASIWFLPFGGLIFNWYTLLGCIGFPILFAAFVVFTLVYLKFKKPVLENLNDVDNTKGSKSWLLLRGTSNNSLSIWKFRINLFISKFLKLFVLISLVSFTFGLGVASFTVVENSNNAVVYNNESKKYTYSLDLISPLENTGLYKEISYSETGITNLDKGINVANIYFTNNDPYGKLMTKEYLVNKTNGSGTEWVDENNLNGRLAIDARVTPSDVFALRDSDGNIIDYDKTTPTVDKKYFTNYILPSYNAFNLVSINYSNLLNDSVLSAFLIDVDLNLGVINLGNIWQNYVKPYIPQKIAYQMEVNLKKFKRLIYDTYPEFTNFIKKTITGNFDPDNIEIDSTKILITDFANDFSNIRLNDEYLTFLGKVFANEELIFNDVKLIAGTTIPINDKNEFTKNEFYDETYTWATSNYIRTKNKNFNDSIKVMGIKNDSDFIFLYDREQQRINLDNLKPNEIIVNEGAALSYNLKIGDSIYLSFNNDYYNSSWTMAQNINTNISKPNNELRLIIKDISNDPVGEHFYSSQNNVNNWINLNNGDFITSIRMNYYEPNFTNTINTISLDEYKINNPDYMPFNGYFTNRSEPLIGDQAILLSSNTGFYSCYFDFSQITTSTYLDPATFSHLYATRSNQDIYNSLNVNNYDELVSLIESKLSSSASVIEWASNEYDNIQILVNLKNTDSKELTNQLFSITSGLINNVNVLLLCIFIPLLFATIIVSIAGIIDLIKKQIGTLRLLGYTSGKITRTILYLFLPSILISGGIGAGIVFIILFVVQNLLYQFTSIFIGTSLNWLIWVIGIAILISLLIFISIVAYIMLKKLKYSQLIKNTYN